MSKKDEKKPANYQPRFTLGLDTPPGQRSIEWLEREAQRLDEEERALQKAASRAGCGCTLL